jgi:hypothetical protein
MIPLGGPAPDNRNFAFFYLFLVNKTIFPSSFIEPTISAAGRRIATFACWLATSPNNQPLT